MVSFASISMVLFHSYVSLLEGTSKIAEIISRSCPCRRADSLHATGVSITPRGDGGQVQRYNETVPEEKQIQAQWGSVGSVGLHRRVWAN